MNAFEERTTFSQPFAFTRNRSLRLQLFAFVAVTAIATGAGFVYAGSRGALIAMACGGACLMLFAVISIARYREISRLAAEIDEVLHKGRSIDFSTCREGDLAVLQSELSKLVARLARANALIESEKGALADALADVSHQIRTPLTAASLVLVKLERIDDARERLRVCRELEMLLDRVSWLVTTLLKIAKLDAGAMRLTVANTRVADVARRAVAPLAASFDLHDVALRVSVTDECFMGDAFWTAEALENIVKNCLEHTPAGGTVSISAREDALACHIMVADTGPGIADTDLPHIFERFYRARNSQVAALDDADANEQQRVPEGFGIGLSLAQALVSAQGGTVRAVNNTTGGARFEITFPKLAAV